MRRCGVNIEEMNTTFLAMIGEELCGVITAVPSRKGSFLIARKAVIG